MASEFIKSMLFVSGITLLGCNEKTTSDGDVIFCTANVVPAIRVDVFDQETGLASACGATVILKDGIYSEEVELEQGDGCDETFTFSGADERAGTYDITVIKDGYIDWYQYDVTVSSNLCHVNTVSVQAYLEK